MPLQPTKRQVINYASMQARRVGLPSSWFIAMLHAESGFDPDVMFGDRRSSAGAIGPGQLMPGTARGLGVNPYNWKQNIQGSARYLKTQYDSFKTMPLALSAYNSGPGGTEKSGRIEGFAETQKYVARVIELEKQYRNLGSDMPVTSKQTLGTMQPESGVPGLPQPMKARAIVQPPSGIYLESLRQLGGPSEMAANQAARFVPRGALETPSLADPEQPPPPQAPQPFQPGSALTGPAPDVSKWLRLPKWGHASGAAEPGQPILNFAAGIAQAAGRPLQVWDTTGHSKMTTNNNVSAHWVGGALDLPATGDELIRLGRIALMRAGMPRKQAMTAGAGLYNVGGYQIIFGTNSAALGGDHTDHLHVGIRGGK